jgi:putative membrane protein
MSALLVFLHHIAAFALVAALTVQIGLLDNDLKFKSARKIYMYDRMFSIAPGMIFVVRLLRSFDFEKGVSHYFQDAELTAP